MAGPAGGGLRGAGRPAVHGLSAGTAAYRRGAADLLRQHGAVQYAAVPAAPLPAYGRCVRRRVDPAAVSDPAGRTAVGPVYGGAGAAVWRGSVAARSAAGVGGGAGGQAPGLVFAAAGGMCRAGGLDGDGIFTGGCADSCAAAVFCGPRAGARRGGRRCAGGAGTGPVRHGRAVSGGGAVRRRVRCRRAAERTKSAGGCGLLRCGCAGGPAAGGGPPSGGAVPAADRCRCVAAAAGKGGDAADGRRRGGSGGRGTCGGLPGGV